MTKKPKSKPMCYGHCGKPARKGHRFCSQRCASIWAEEMAMGNEDVWCEDCGDWVYPDYHTGMECPLSRWYAGGTAQ